LRSLSQSWLAELIKWRGQITTRERQRLSGHADTCSHQSTGHSLPSLVTANCLGPHFHLANHLFGGVVGPGDIRLPVKYSIASPITCQTHDPPLPDNVETSFGGGSTDDYSSKHDLQSTRVTFFLSQRILPKHHYF